MDIDLTDEEKKFLALAIQGLTLRQGQSVFSLALACAKKLDIEQYLQTYLQDWIDCADER